MTKKTYTKHLLFLLIIFSNQLFSQTLRAYERKAEEAFSTRDYTGALAYYKQLLEIDSQRVDAMFYAGEAARMVRAYDIAELHFELIPDTAKIGFYNTTDFRMANVKKGLEKYDEAIVYYNQFLNTQPNADPLFIERAEAELEYCEWALGVLQDAEEMEVKHLDTSLINSYCIDFAPVMFKGLLYFSSGDDCFEGENVSAKIFSTYQDGKTRAEEINFDPQNDTLNHVSNLAISPGGSRAFFTLCQNDPEYVGEYRCEIYFVRLNQKGLIASAPQKLPPNINKEGYTTTQPSIGLDAITGKEILFFVSDRPEGKGGMDIWAAPIEQGDMFFQPHNLANINTESDEVTPYYHSESNTLYFSSEGYKSLGGFDIFQTYQKNNSWVDPINLSPPLNSSYDDLYFTLNSKENKIFFASNRKDALCFDPEKGCTCTDIFESSFKVQLVLSTFNSIDSTDLDGVLVQLIDNEKGLMVAGKRNEENNTVIFDLDLEKDYTVVSTKDDYEFDNDALSTKGLNSNHTFTKSQFLKPKIFLIAQTYDMVSREPINGSKVQLFNKLTNRDTLVMLPLITNEVRFPLDFKNNYNVTGAKNGFLSARDTFETFQYSKPTIVTEKLYLTPFKLPITLYFDNDKPRYIQKSDTTTKLTYEQTYNDYLKRRAAFEEFYTKDLIGDAKKVRQNELNKFFDSDVIKSWESFETFCYTLIPYLEDGNSIAVIVEGYASPLAEDEYNEKLTGRRVSSVVNQLRVFEEGVLAPYLDSGQLILKEEPKGEKLAKEFVSDDEKDRRASVFSPTASRERRVRIIDVRKQEGTLSFLEKNKHNKNNWEQFKAILTRRR